MPRKRTIDVTGRASIRVAPTIATVQLTVWGHSKTSASAIQERISETMAELIQSLRAKTDITVLSTEPALHTRYSYEKGVEKFMHYEATNTLIFEVKDIEVVGSLLDIATKVAENALRIDDVHFGLDNETRTQKDLEVLIKATHNAKLKAQEVARVFNAIVIGVQRAAEQMVYRPSPMRRQVMAMQEMASDAPQAQDAVEPGIVEMEATLNLVAEISHEAKEIDE